MVVAEKTNISHLRPGYRVLRNRKKRRHEKGGSGETNFGGSGEKQRENPRKRNPRGKGNEYGGGNIQEVDPPYQRVVRSRRICKIMKARQTGRRLLNYFHNSRKKGLIARAGDEGSAGKTAS